MTRVVMTLLVRDEADIVRENLDFHLGRGVDFVIATDNGSVDGTVEILQEYEAEGALRLLRETDDDYAQGRWVTRMARLARGDHGADWVINNDADEFWWCSGGDLREALQALPAETNVVLAERSNFVPLTPEVGPFHERMIFREAHSLNPLGAPLPPKCCHRSHGELTVHQGNHGVSWDQPTRVADSQPLEIFHFPMRSYGQFENKIRLGGAAYERNQELPAGIGRTWRQLYRTWLDGDLPAHYQARQFDASRVALGLAEGTLIEDQRLHRELVRLRATRRA